MTKDVGKLTSMFTLLNNFIFYLLLLHIIILNQFFIVVITWVHIFGGYYGLPAKWKIVSRKYRLFLRTFFVSSHLRGIGELNKKCHVFKFFLFMQNLDPPLPLPPQKLSLPRCTSAPP